MKKTYYLLILAFLGLFLSLSFSSCSSEEDGLTGQSNYMIGVTASHSEGTMEEVADAEKKENQVAQALEAALGTAFETTVVDASVTVKTDDAKALKAVNAAWEKVKNTDIGNCSITFVLDALAYGSKGYVTLATYELGRDPQ